MNFLGGTDVFQPARKALANLSRDVIFAYDAIHDVPKVHKGRKFKSAAVRFAIKAEELENHFTPRVQAVAAKITALAQTDTHWEENNGILALWHQLASVVTHFSEHPTKKVASLIVSADGVLQAFAANRVPEGVTRHGAFYEKGVRKDFIVCSERMAVARLLQLRVRPSNLHKIRKHDRPKKMRDDIRQLTADITQTGKNSKILHNSLILTTITMCEICAHAIVPFQPSGIYAPKNSGGHFTRAAGFEKTQALCQDYGVPIFGLPRLSFN